MTEEQGTSERLSQQKLDLNNNEVKSQRISIRQSYTRCKRETNVERAARTTFKVLRSVCIVATFLYFNYRDQRRVDVGAMI